MSNLDSVINDINKQFKDQLIQKGTGRLANDKIPFSSPRANYITYGGIPLGKSTEFFGPEGGGKTTTAIDICKNAQIKAQKEYEDKVNDLENQIEKLGDAKSYQKQVEKLNQQLDAIMEQGVRKVAYVDLENTLDEDWAKTLGVDTDELILIRPQNQTAEQVLEIVLNLIKTGNLILIVLDSAPMLVPQQVYEETMEKKMYGGASGPLTTFASRVSPALSRHNCAYLGINQSREDFDNPFNQTATPGGRAYKHLHSLRILFNKGSLIDEDNKEQPQRFENPAGHLVQMKVIKTKVSKPDRPLGFYTLKYATGIDVLSDTIDISLLYGLLTQNTSYYSLLAEDDESIMTDAEGKELKFQGKAKLLTFLRTETLIFESIQARLMEKIK